MVRAILRGAITLLCRMIIAWMGGLKTVGREKVPRKGGVIIAPNHLSYTDGIVVGLSLPRRASFMATSELFTIRWWGWIARLMGAFPVKQDSPDREAIRKAVAMLKSGAAIVIFPEGHMSLDGQLQRPQHGVLFIALRAEVPIVPVWIEGTNHLMPPRQTKMRRVEQPILVRFGEAISPQDLAGGLSGRAAIEHAADLLYRKLLELSGSAASGTE